MKAQHTQGEWYVSDIPQEDGFYIYSTLDQFNAIARVYKGNNTNAENAEANAALIAAAPSMLQALESAYKCSGEKNFLTESVLDEILSAIKKAKGK